MKNYDAIAEYIYDAVKRTMHEVGVEEFKKCSFFGSNDPLRKNI